MVSLEEFIIYAYIFNDVFRLSFVFGVSSGMYFKLYFAAIASVVSFVVFSLILVKSRKAEDRLTYIYVALGTLVAGVAILAVAIASYFYINCPSIFTFIPETTGILYRILYILFPLIGLFFWLFFSRLIQIRRVVVYIFVIFSLVILFVNTISTTITVSEVQLVSSVSIGLVVELIGLIYWLSVFLVISFSFYHFAAKQKGELRIKGLLFGTAGIAGIMVQLSAVFSLISNTMILQESSWIFAVAVFILMYFGLFPPKRLLAQTKGK